METGIALRRYDDVQYERTALLRAVAAKLNEDGITFDPNILESLASRVMTQRGFNMNNPHHVLKAQAAVMLMLNYALTVIVQTKIEKDGSGETIAIAVKALTKNPIPAIFALGEKRHAELVARAAKLVRENVIEFSDHDGKHYYGIVGAQHESNLSRWSQGQLSDTPDLPLASIEEERPITDALYVIEETIRLGKMVDWKLLFNSKPISDFAIAHFARPSRNVPSPLGGMWQPFLVSLMTKVLTGHSGRQLIGTHDARNAMLRLVFVDAETVAKFVDMLTADRPELERRAPEFAFTVAKIVIRPPSDMRLLKQEGTEEDFRRIIAMAQEVITELSRDAWAFLYSVVDTEQPTDREVDDFWRGRLLLHVEFSWEERQRRREEAYADMHQPWVDAARRCRSFGDAVRMTVGFTRWPQAERRRFVEQIDVAGMMTFHQRSYAKAKDLYDFWLHMLKAVPDGTLLEILVHRTPWEGHAMVLAIMAKEHPCEPLMPYLKQAMTRTCWSLEAIQALIGSIGTAPLLPTAFSQATVRPSKQLWSKLIATNTVNFPAMSAALWDAMTPEEREVHLLEFASHHVAFILMRSTPDEAVSIIDPMFARAAASSENLVLYRRWFYVGTADYNMCDALRAHAKEHFTVISRAFLRHFGSGGAQY